MLGHGGASHFPHRSRARAAVGALLVAASLVPGVSALASAGDEGPDEPTTSAPPTTAEAETPPTTTPPATEPSTTTAPPTTTPPATDPSTTTVAPSPSTTAPPTATAAPAEPTAEPNSATATARARCSVSRTLRRHSTGPGVVCLERALAARGHHIAGPNLGRYDHTTVAAVRSLQQRRGILITGVAGPATLVELGIWSGTPIDVRCSVGRIVLRGTFGARSRCVEQRLIQLGYILPGPDRLFDGDSARAAQTFQRNRGFVIANGAVGPWTLAKLRLWSGNPLTVACNVSRPVLEGSRGAAARCVEQRLIQLGYALGGPNRSFDATATDFLRRYQSRIGVQPDGRAGKFVLTALRVWKQPPRVTCKVGRTVREGTTGRPARCVERKLIALGYALYGPDRNFDATAADALRAYQASKGLDVDGIAGPFTLFSLGLWSGHNPYGPPPPPSHSGTGRRIVYSRAMQRIWAIEADGTVVKTHLVSGRLYEPYAGTYSVYSRSMYTYSTADPDVKWRYMVRFAYGPDGGRVGLHEIPTRFGVPLQSESQLGQPLSGGCVRQSTSDAIWTWNWAYLGTKVVVL
jgi:peptidoglycan hydrolase-like protein with peptidoglycan-binding domain